MKRAHRIYLVRRQLLGFALISFLLNSVLGWLLYEPLALPWKGLTLGVDALVLLLATALLIGPLVIPQGKEKIQRAQLPPVSPRSRSRVWVQRLPADLMGRVVVIGLSVAIVSVPFILSVLTVLGSFGLNLELLILIRAGLAAAAAGLMAAIFAWIGVLAASS